MTPKGQDRVMNKEGFVSMAQILLPRCVYVLGKGHK